MVPSLRHRILHQSSHRLRHLSSLLGRFRRSERATAFVEFTLIAPFLIALFLGGFELTRYINTTRKLTYVANTIAGMVAQNTSGSVNANDLNFYKDSTMLVFPDVLSDAKRNNQAWGWAISLQISSVAFTPTVAGCSSACTYKARVGWSTGSYRPCSVDLSPVADTATPTPTTLPTDVFGPGSLIVVDVTYTYKPIVATQIFGPMTIRRSAYLQPRYVSTVGYDWGQGWIAQVC